MPDLKLKDANGVVRDNPPAEELLEQLLPRLQTGQPAMLDGVWPATGWRFSNHGTAIAGLIGGRPRKFKHIPLANSDPVDIDLPFAGVDPFCEIVPISTNFDPDPWQYMRAFLYAELIDADVVVVPRDFPDPTRRTADNSGHRERDPWGALEKLIIAVSENRPVVCAAGNGGDDNVIYPACLADSNNGVIAVGAVNAKGYRAGYSSRGGQITIMAPSSDDERFDREEVRLDAQDPDFDKDMKLWGANVVDFYSHLNVISTDVPGRYGYNGSRFREPFLEEALRDYGSFYCQFGGTSAAAALVGGFISLGITSGLLDKEKADGLRAKKWLLSNGKAVPKSELVVPVWPNKDPKKQDPNLPPPPPTLSLPDHGKAARNEKRKEVQVG